MTIDEYEDNGRALYAGFAEAVAAILRAAIAERPDLKLQNVQRRAKDIASLRTKLDRAGANAEAVIGEIAKDIAGCRLLFYTNGDVYRFGQSGILRENFDIDFERSKIHYPQNSDEGAEFFISENWVVRLTEGRGALPEYRRFVGLRCEVQVQTILDHAWAEMAHDTIYKPMTDVGFGSGAIEGMRKRLRKVMRDYLQPAGYEFQKIASDYARLRHGKSMFDEDALAIIRACQDRNCLADAIERFSAHVLPHYDDFQAWASEILATLSDAAVRAVAMPDVSQKTYFRQSPGTKIEAVLAQVCRVLESGYLLYIDPNRMFDVIITMRAAARTDEQRKPIDDLARRFAQHDRGVWQHAGSGLQRMIVDRITALGEEEILGAAAVVTLMLRESLSSTVSGTTWQAETVTLHTGAVAITDALIAMRRDALQQLQRLHGLLTEGEAREAVRHAMTAAGNTPDNAGYSDALGVVIMDDLTKVVGFFTAIATDLPLEPKRRLEVELFRIFYHYHALPPAMAENEAIVVAQARLLEAVTACRAVLDSDADLARYRLLVGYDSVSRLMWEKASYDYEGTGAERSAGIDALVATVSELTADQWLTDLERYVQTRSADGAMFLGFQEFLKKLAAAAPAVLLAWLPRLSDRLADWLPGMLHELAEVGQGNAIDPIIGQWVADGKHIPSIACYLQWAERFRFDLLITITERALHTADDRTLGNVAVAAARQSERHPDGLFDQVYLPAARALTGRGDYRWVGGMFNWGSIRLLRDLNAPQVDELLALLVDVPRLGTRGEEILAVIAERFPDAVLDLIGRRFERERTSDDVRYEALLHDLHYLRTPLVSVPDRTVAAAQTWFDANPSLAEFHAGRLIAELFPNLEHPLQPLLRDHINRGRDGIAFVLSVLRAYKGQAFLHPLLRDIVNLLDPEDEQLTIVSIVIDSTGVLVGEYGFVEAQQARKELIAAWESDERAKVRAFAAGFVKSVDNTLASERRRADASVAMRRIHWEE